MEGFEGNKGKGKWCTYIIPPQNKKEFFKNRKQTKIFVQPIFWPRGRAEKNFTLLLLHMPHS